MLVALAFPGAHASLLVNQPSVGQTLFILDEGAGNATALVRMPDGKKLEIALEHGQASLNASVGGRWLVFVGNESASVLVKIPQDAGPGAGARFADSDSLFPPFTWALLMLIFLVLLALAAFAVYATLVAPKARPATLTKERHGSEVSVTLRAGEQPLSHASILDPAGPQWADPPLRLSARHLDAGQALTLRYAYDGPLGEAHAAFEQGGIQCALRCAEGRAQAEPAAEALPSLMPAREEKKAARSLRKSA
ncbi:MAG: hypothetical protein V1728_00750 [Candidatus Micrarchaeota archaeon]